MGNEPFNRRSGEQGERQGGDYVVIGQELARAKEAERAWQASGAPVNNPMPEGGYDFWRGENNLTRPVPLPLDSQLAVLCEGYRQTDEQQRQTMRSGISMQGFYTLLAFSRRAAAFAMREQSPRWLEDGLTAIAMIELERVDFRDVIVALAILHHAAERIHVNAGAALVEAAALAGEGVAGLIISFQNRSRKKKELRSAAGIDVVETECGIGFVRRSYADYNPTFDLARIAIECADRIATDKYQTTSIEIATSFPRDWVELEDRAIVDRLLGEIRGVASINGTLRPTEHPLSDRQVFVVWLMEMASESVAERFVEIVAKKKIAPLRYSMLGLAVGRLACLICARCVNANATQADKYETNESLPRFLEPMAAVLRPYASEGGAQAKEVTDIGISSGG